MAPDEEDQKPIIPNPFGEAEFYDKLKTFHTQRGYVVISGFDLLSLTCISL